MERGTSALSAPLDFLLQCNFFVVRFPSTFTLKPKKIIVILSEICICVNLDIGVDSKRRISLDGKLCGLLNDIIHRVQDAI